MTVYSYPSQANVEKPYKYWECACGCSVNFQSEDTCLRCQKRRIYVIIDNEEEINAIRRGEIRV